MQRQANIPHESPVDRMGKKYEGGPRPTWGNSWQPLRCLSPPWARKGGEGERPDGKKRGERGEMKKKGRRRGRNLGLGM